jgi:YVTN family beta-propeller protein
MRTVLLAGTITMAALAAGGCAHAGARAGMRTVARVDAAVGYRAYLTLTDANEVLRVDTSAGPAARMARMAEDNAGEGVAVTPDGGTLYVAETGQYDVLRVNTVTGKRDRIEVGPFPQDVAVAPSGRLAYATVTGGDTGAGGSDVVAVIDTAAGTVRADITVGTSPRQVVFSPDGAIAYVSTEHGIYVIDVATSAVIRVIPDRQGPQGMAVSADGRTLYVTNPDAGTLWAVDPATGTLLTSTATGPEPYAVAVAGSSLYVTDMNSDTVSVLSPATGRVTGTIAVGRLPMSIAATPDGAQVWVGNGLSGTVSVISAASGKVAATIRTERTGTAVLGIAFAASRLAAGLNRPFGRTNVATTRFYANARNLRGAGWLVWGVCGLVGGGAGAGGGCGEGDGVGGVLCYGVVAGVS